VRALLPEPDPVALPRNRVGSLVHGVLQRVLDGLRAELAAGAAPSLLLAPAQAHAAELLRTELARAAAHVRADFPALFALRAEQWVAAVHEVLAFDLRRLERERARIAAVEREIEGELRVTRPGREPLALSLRGRIDRIDRLRDGGLRIIDYKTGARPQLAIAPLEVLRGRKLQLAVYAMLLEAGGEGSPSALEVLAVRPTAPGENPDGPSAQLADVDRWLRGDRRAALEETLAILGGVIEAGSLPPDPDPDTCRACDFRLACRRLHPPSLERVRACPAPALASYRLLATKKLAEPVLAGQEP
jgi:RecB family exonuclease